MLVHYERDTMKVVQISHGAQTFQREGFLAAVTPSIPDDLGGGYVVDPASLRPAITDPVCGAVIDLAKSVRPVEHDGKQYRFCSTNCAVKFFVEPDKCLAERPPTDDQWQCCEIIALPAPPPPPPTEREVKAARDAELAATDAYMIEDRPMSDEMREQWRAYRQALRDLGDLATAAEMIAAWPVRPTRQDVVAELRARV